MFGKESKMQSLYITDFCLPPVVLVFPAEFETGVVRRRHGKRSALPRTRNVCQRRRAPTRRQLLGSGHPPARDHPPLLRPLPGQASVRGLQRAAAHLPLLHEGPVFGGCRLAAGSGTGILWPQAATHQKLTNREAALKQNSGRTPSFSHTVTF